MQTANDIIAHSLTSSKLLLLRLVEDLQPSDYLHRPTAKANCAAWILGHLALSDRRVMANLLGVTDLPPLPDGFEKRFSRDEGCPQAEAFGDVSALAKTFAQTRDLLIEKVRTAAPETLERPLPSPHPMFKTAGEAANFMAVHSALHAGQISTIRRSLGRPPVL